VSTIALFGWWVLGGVDGYHARNLMNDTPLGGLFKYCCDLLTVNFLVVVMCVLYDCDLRWQWYCVQSVQLILLSKHYSAFAREAGLRYFLVGPGEIFTWATLLLTIRAIFNLDVIYGVYFLTWGLAQDFLVKKFGYFSSYGYLATMDHARALYLTTFAISTTRIFFTKHHSWSKKMILLILGLRAASAFLQVVATTTEADVIFDGLFMAMVTSDLIVAKMAGREIHVWVVMMALCVVVPGVYFIVVVFVIFYYIAVFADISNHMNLPLLAVCRNVYCDGVYDLCHVGHKNLFRQALTYGNRLFVGVCGDEDCKVYKRPPVMSAKEREAEVAMCKCVTKVIPNAPCFGLTLEFIKHHRLHIVCFGEEYEERYPDPDNDPYYRVPRKLGIARKIPRTPGLSTSDLIARIQSSDADSLKRVA